MTFSHLECDRLSIDLAVSAVRERVPVLESTLVDALRTRLGEALAPFAAGRDDGASLFIDRLVIADAIGGNWDLEAIVRQVAARIAAGISAQIDGAGGVRFHDRVEFVAAFLASLADGSAWGRWWFSEFEGFKALSTSNALRSVMLTEERAGIAALAKATAETARRVIAAMNQLDLNRVLAAWRCQPGADVPVGVLWREALSLDQDIGVAPSRWIAALLSCERAVAGGAGDHSIATLRDMRALLESSDDVWRGESSDIAGLRHWLSRRAAGPDRSREWVSRATDVELREVATRLQARKPSEDAVLRFWTPFGGALLLLGTMSRLEWFGQWIEIAGPADCRTLALAVVARALTPEQGLQVLGDAGLLAAIEISGVAEALEERPEVFEPLLLTTQAIGRSRDLRLLLDSAAAVLMTEFASRLPGLVDSSADYLRRNLLSLSAEMRMNGDDVRVTLGRAPLDVLLVMGGIKNRRFELPGSRPIICSAEAVT